MPEVVPAGTTGATARIVGPGVWALEVTVPSLTLGTTNCYLVRTSDGDVLVDSGHAHPVARAGLADALAQAGSAPEAVRGVVLTHGHYDHSGCAAALRRGGAWLGLHPRDAGWLSAAADQAATEAAVHEVCLRSGAPVAQLPTPYHAASAKAPESEPEPEPAVEIDVALDGSAPVVVGDVELAVLPTPGHTDGHVALVAAERGVVFTGDAVFARGSSVLVLTEEPDGDSPADPVGDAHATFARLAELGELVGLPGHGAPLTDLRDRAAAVRERSLRRLDAVAAALGTQPRTPWEIAEGLAWGFTWATAAPPRKRAALLSTLAYLRALHREGALRRVPDPAVLRYATS